MYALVLILMAIATEVVNAAPAAPSAHLPPDPISRDQAETICHSLLADGVGWFRLIAADSKPWYQTIDYPQALVGTVALGLYPADTTGGPRPHSREGYRVFSGRVRSIERVDYDQPWRIQDSAGMLHSVSHFEVLFSDSLGGPLFQPVQDKAIDPFRGERFRHINDVQLEEQRDRFSLRMHALADQSISILVRGLRAPAERDPSETLWLPLSAFELDGSLRGSAHRGEGVIRSLEELQRGARSLVDTLPPCPGSHMLRTSVRDHLGWLHGRTLLMLRWQSESLSVERSVFYFGIEQGGRYQVYSGYPLSPAEPVESFDFLGRSYRASARSVATYLPERFPSHEVLVEWRWSEWDGP